MTTIYVWVDEGWLDHLDPPSDAQLDMPDRAFNTRASSRLRCQIRVTPAWAGLAVPRAERARDRLGLRNVLR